MYGRKLGMFSACTFKLVNAMLLLSFSVVCLVGSRFILLIGRLKVKNINRHLSLWWHSFFFSLHFWSFKSFGAIQFIDLKNFKEYVIIWTREPLEVTESLKDTLQYKTPSSEQTMESVIESSKCTHLKSIQVSASFQYFHLQMFQYKVYFCHSATISPFLFYLKIMIR